MRFVYVLSTLLALASSASAQTPSLDWSDTSCACFWGAPCECVTCSCQNCECPSCGKVQSKSTVVEASCQIVSNMGRGGSGVCIYSDKEQSVVLTNAHVVQTYPETITATFPNGRKLSLKPWHIDHAKDIAILRAMDVPPVPCVALAEESPDQGDMVLQVGYPAPVPEKPGEKLPVVRSGKVVGFQKLNRWEMFAKFNPNTRSGDSGSPYFSKGRVVALHWGQMADTPVSVPLKTLRDNVQTHGLSKGLFPGEDTRSWTGKYWQYKSGWRYYSYEERWQFGETKISQNPVSYAPVC